MKKLTPIEKLDLLVLPYIADRIIKLLEGDKQVRDEKP